LAVAGRSNFYFLQVGNQLDCRIHKQNPLWR
jgi:hypothetical protein